MPGEFVKSFNKLKQKPFFYILALAFLGLWFILTFIFGLKTLAYILVLIFVFLKPFYGVLIYIALLPFHAFLVSSARHFLNLSNWEFFLVSTWKEIILIILFLRVFGNFLKTKKFPFRLYLVDKLIFVFFFLALLSVWVNKISPAQAIWGAKYDLEFFVHVCREVPVQIMNFDYPDKKAYLTFACIQRSA